MVIKVIIIIIMTNEANSTNKVGSALNTTRSLILTVALAAAAISTADAGERSSKKSAKATLDANNSSTYWDANAWDKAGGNSFWHEGDSSKRKTISATRNQAPRPKTPFVPVAKGR